MEPGSSATAKTSPPQDVVKMTEAVGEVRTQLKRVDSAHSSAEVVTAAANVAEVVTAAANVVAE